jgi:hypothetical protein
MQIQSIQSARLSVQSSNWVPHPLIPRRVLPPPLWVPGGRHTSIQGRGGGPNSDEGTNTLGGGQHSPGDEGVVDPIQRKGHIRSGTLCKL